MPTDLRPTVSSFELAQEPTTRRRGITTLTVDIPSSHHPQAKEAHHSPARWKSPEFILYAIIFCVVVPIMIWIPMRLSSPSHRNYVQYNRRLSPGWMFGRRVDNSDAQYRSFRNNMFSLVLLAGVFLGAKLVYTSSIRRLWSRPASDRTYLVPFLCMFSVLMLAGLHGTSAIKIIAILSMNYAIGKTCRGSKLGPTLTWLFNAGILYTSERAEGYRFEILHSSLGFLDSIPGIYPRWHVSFNITALRLISFNLDYHWACNGVGTASWVKSDSTMTEKQRKTTAHPLERYSYANFFAYVLYPPLYIAGPIMTFNDFVWQLHRPAPVSLRGTLSYLFRFLVCFLTLEFILHFMYVVAIKDTKAWAGDSAAELCMIGFWNLIVVWLKLLIPWRFFRLWALADGMDPLENMVRCMANNYSTLGFWRSWHRSYNLWIVRYIYVPLGGTNNVVFATLIIFSFVALWHDLSFRLLAWGWLVSLFILPELIARYLLSPTKYGSRWWYRHVCAVGAVLNILMMMAANLVGFVIGIDGISYMLHQLTDTWEGLRFLAFACACLFVGAQIMFEYREEELRCGIVRRC
ncbi:MBOAT-domain-containing protein [Laetiporus sulphureus 93-53]|uniref:MBOAT-domain-containing protein n=1 Tax=Laetiporus sulphureus 93-53 TaxID=1314785 RepID=A0A165CC65_9APHY|nr:MBOAT-domain-containing protein [Laetiporus sulphureus 93-53]KZT02547.1 MBOAT-domain-containing protein [Laetiporus sulphureus 93-53]